MFVKRNEVKKREGKIKKGVEVDNGDQKRKEKTSNPQKLAKPATYRIPNHQTHNQNTADRSLKQNNLSIKPELG